MSNIDITFRVNMEEFNQFAHGETREVAAFLERIGAKVERRAKYLCPVDTGRLRSSITHGLFVADGTFEERIGTDVEYAAFVELGTSRMSAQPYLRPALAAETGMTGADQ